MKMITVMDKHFAKALVDTPMRYLSKADTESLDHAIELVKNLSFSQRSKLTHDEAWESAKETGRPILFEKIVLASGGQTALDHMIVLQEARNELAY